jgi:transcription initiation factor TFIIH subunit 3
LLYLSTKGEANQADINRLTPPTTTTSLTETQTQVQDRIEPRILIINATPGSQGSDTAEGGQGSGAVGEGKSTGGRMRGGYVGLMNCVFAAQKAVS